MVTRLWSALLLAIRRLFGEYDDAGTFALHDFVHAAGSAREALLYSGLFCPVLNEVDGCVLLQRSAETAGDETRFLNLVQRTGDRSKAEAAFNFVEVPYLFSRDRCALSEEEDMLLAELVAHAWRGHLLVSYPDRIFIVEVLDEATTGDVPGVHFYERRDTE